MVSRVVNQVNNPSSGETRRQIPKIKLPQVFVRQTDEGLSITFPKTSKAGLDEFLIDMMLVPYASLGESYNQNIEGFWANTGYLIGNAIKTGAASIVVGSAANTLIIKNLSLDRVKIKKLTTLLNDSNTRILNPEAIKFSMLEQYIEKACPELARMFKGYHPTELNALITETQIKAIINSNAANPAKIKQIEALLLSEVDNINAAVNNYAQTGLAAKTIPMREQFRLNTAEIREIATGIVSRSQSAFELTSAVCENIGSQIKTYCEVTIKSYHRAEISAIGDFNEFLESFNGKAARLKFKSRIRELAMQNRQSLSGEQIATAYAESIWRSAPEGSEFQKKLITAFRDEETFAKIYIDSLNNNNLVKLLREGKLAKINKFIADTDSFLRAKFGNGAKWRNPRNLLRKGAWGFTILVLIGSVRKGLDLLPSFNTEKVKLEGTTPTPAQVTDQKQQSGWKNPDPEYEQDMQANGAHSSNPAIGHYNYTDMSIGDPITQNGNYVEILTAPTSNNIQAYITTEPTNGWGAAGITNEGVGLPAVAINNGNFYYGRGTEDASHHLGELDSNYKYYKVEITNLDLNAGTYNVVISKSNSSDGGWVSHITKNNCKMNAKVVEPLRNNKNKFKMVKSVLIKHTKE